MRSNSILPGRPEPSRLGVCTALWRGVRIIAYVTGSSLAIIDAQGCLIQIVRLARRLKGVVFNDQTGHFAVWSKEEATVICFRGYHEGQLQWGESVTVEAGGNGIEVVAWATDKELITASSSLCLWDVEPTGTLRAKLQWRVEQANAVKLLSCSPDGLLIATVAADDRMVKIWKRSPYGAGVSQYDFSYLAHPRAVRDIFWSQPLHKEQTADNVLYTVAKDCILRLWSPVHPHESYLLQMWNSIDLLEIHGPGVLRDSGDNLSVLLVDNRDFMSAVETVVASNSTESSSLNDGHGVLQLSSLAARFSEIFLTITNSSRLVVWGIENTGSRAQKSSNALKIVSKDIRNFSRKMEAEDLFLQACSFHSDCGLTLVAHHTSGTIRQYKLYLQRLLQHSDDPPVVVIENTFTGQRNGVRRLVRDLYGNSLLSLSEKRDMSVWVRNREDCKDTPLRLKSLLANRRRVENVILLGRGRKAVALGENELSLFDTTSIVGQKLARVSVPESASYAFLLQLPEEVNEPNIHHVAALTNRLTGRAWKVKYESLANIWHFESLGDVNFGLSEELSLLVPVDPSGWTVKVSGFLDVFSRDVAISMSKSGMVRTWAAKVASQDNCIKWLCTSATATGITAASLIKANSKRKFALVDGSRTKLSIWNSKNNQIEYDKEYNAEEIRDLDWTCTPKAQSILAVGFLRRVVLLCQLRYDFLEKSPSWTEFREIELQSILPEPIGDALWLDRGELVVASGNQLTVYPRSIDEADAITSSLHLMSHNTKLDDIFEIVENLNGHLPVFHPQFLQQCILYGKLELVEKILVKLYRELRDYHEEVPMDAFLCIPMQDFLSSQPNLPPSSNPRLSPSYSLMNLDGDGYELSASLADQLGILLQQIAVPRLSSAEQRNLAAIVECVNQAKLHARSIDENGTRFLLFFRLNAFRRIHPGQRCDVTYREISWAFHSESQEILVDIVNEACGGRMMWKDARASGIALWMRDADSLRKQFEKLARNHYVSTPEKNPVDCSLFYLALRKKTILSGLWRMASWHKEQASTARFLANDFTEQRWKAAAKKNAFALMSKHRFEYAAAFFLLADSLREAVNICFTQMQDLQLAIAIARVYEGDNGPVLNELVKSRIIPLAIQDGNRWLASWCYSFMKDNEKALQALITPLTTVGTKPDKEQSLNVPRLKNMLFTMDDPALIVLYRHLRDKSAQSFKSVQSIAPNEEFEFVLNTARVNDRMGCDILALDLVKNWRFSLHTAPSSVANATEESTVNAATRFDTSEGFHKASQYVSAPTTFEEPDMSWAF